MLFPTATFAIFFMIVLPLSWALMRSGERWRAFIIAASFVFYAGWDWRFCFLLAFSIVWNQAFALAIHRRSSKRARKQLLGHRIGRKPGPARVLQVLRLLRHRGEQPLRARRHRRAARGAIDPPPGRHLLLHVHGDQLRRRRLPRRLRAGRPRHVRGVPLVLPAPRRRPDRAAGRAHPPVPVASRPALRGHVARVLPHRDGALHEGRDREPPRREHRGRGLRRAEPALVARGARRDLRVLGADLRRLLRLHEHRDRDRAPARLHLPAELRRAVLGDLDHGLLAPLAHDAVALAARLPLHPARRKPRRDAPHLSQPDADDAHRRPLARGRLDVRRLGRDPRDARSSSSAGGASGRGSSSGRGRAAAARGIGSSRSRSSASPGSSSARTRSRTRGISSSACSPPGASPPRS